jgi:bifunctional non-homologous end joining protein LigD
MPKIIVWPWRLKIILMTIKTSKALSRKDNGGGTVLVWDNGTYEPDEKIEGKKEQEHWLLSNYYKNKLSIILHGKKLKGKFNLVKTFGKGENAWLLTKVKDGYKLKTDIIKKDESVISGYTILEVAMNSHSKVWQNNRTEPPRTESELNANETGLDAEIPGAEVLDQPRDEETAEDIAVKHVNAGELRITKNTGWALIFSELI